MINAKNPILLKFLHSPNEETAKKSTKILMKNELLRIDDTGKFKVGDGKSSFEELDYSCTLPEEIYFRDFDGIVEVKTPM